MLRLFIDCAVTTIAVYLARTGLQHSDIEPPLWVTALVWLALIALWLYLYGCRKSKNVAACQTLHNNLQPYLKELQANRTSEHDSDTFNYVLFKPTCSLFYEVADFVEKGIVTEGTAIINDAVFISSNLQRFFPWADVAFRWFEMVDDLVEGKPEKREFKEKLYSRIPPKDAYLLWLCNLVKTPAKDVLAERHFSLSNIPWKECTSINWWVLNETQKAKTAYIICKLLQTARENELNKETLASTINTAVAEFSKRRRD